MNEKFEKPLDLWNSKKPLLGQPAETVNYSKQPEEPHMISFVI